ncbi:MAG: lipopolysaccharide heptosyltransferase II [Candidatus Aminicenantes bacterium]|nr:lipopolysaccharide heptosyltransferase II [Candidatus Aminicenantes bacterium]
MKIVVRTPNWIGDSILCIPALKCLQKNHPEAEIWLAADRWVQGLFRSFDFVKGFVPIPESGSIKSYRSAAKKLKTYLFDAGLLFPNSFSSALLFFLAGIPHRWGFNRDGRGFLLTQSVKKNSIGEIHQAEYYLSLLRLLGMKIYTEELSLPLSSDEKKEARESLLKLNVDFSRPLIFLNPGAYYGSAKRWPVSRFAELASLLQKNHKGNIIITGSAEEIPLSEKIASSMDLKPIILSGRTTIRQLSAFISQADVFVTNDSGPMHIANAFKIPVVAVFGPTDPKITGPLQDPSKVLFKQAACWPCFYRDCPFDHRCMMSISPEEVYEACRSFLK